MFRSWNIVQQNVLITSLELFLFKIFWFYYYARRKFFKRKLEFPRALTFASATKSNILREQTFTNLAKKRENAKASSKKLSSFKVC